MDRPSPKDNGTNLQNISPAWEEVFYGCDQRAQFHGVLVGRGGPCRGPDNEGCKANEVHSTKRWRGTGRIFRYTSTHLLPFETFVVQIPVVTATPKSLLAARQQTPVAGRILRAES
jgi:hypothetical protein